MKHAKVMEAVEQAWFSFYDELYINGLSREEISHFKKALSDKDVYNAVDDCALEAVR